MADKSGNKGDAPPGGGGAGGGEDMPDFMKVQRKSAVISSAQSKFRGRGGDSAPPGTIVVADDEYTDLWQEHTIIVLSTGSSRRTR